MATLQAVARERKNQLRQLLTVSKKLDAAQETLEREVKRLIARKRSTPEISDAIRLANLAKNVDSALSGMSSVISSVSTSWGAQF